MDTEAWIQRRFPTATLLTLIPAGRGRRRPVLAAGTPARGRSAGRAGAGRGGGAGRRVRRRRGAARHPRTIAPVSTNRATDTEYAAVAAGLHGKVISPGEAGTLAHFCADRCAIDDPFAERAPMLARIAQRRAGTAPVTRGLLDLNQLFLDPALHHRGTTRLLSRRATTPTA